MSKSPAVSQDAAGPAPAPPKRIPLGAWYGLGLLAVINAMSYVDRVAIALLLEPIKADLQINDQSLGLLSGLAFGLFYAIMGIPLARLADRASRKKVIAVCLSLWSVMTALSGLARSFPQLFLARVGVGVGEAGGVPASHSMISDMFPRERRALAIAIFQIGGGIGLSAGMFVVGLLAQHHGWRATLQIIGLAGLPLALLVLLTLREPPRPAATIVGESARTALAALFRRPAYLHLIVAYALAGLTTYGVVQWWPTFLIRSFGMSMAQVGAWSGLAGAVGGAAGLLSGGFIATWLAPRDRRWELWLPAVAYGAALPIYVLKFLSPTPTLAIILHIVGTVLTAAGSGASYTAAHSFAEPHRRATAIALMIFVWSIFGQGLGPYLIGLGSDLLEPRFGRESLRFALVGSSAVLAWAVLHYGLAARRAAGDRFE